MTPSRSARSARCSVDDRFWVKVDRGDGCWLWRGATNGSYGFVTRFGRVMGAHRFAWLDAIGPIPPDLWVLHHCDVPLCVRPDHLFLGTQSDNMLDASRKRRLGQYVHPERLPRGERHYMFGKKTTRSRDAAGRFV